tara:strand:+ start:353 stop:1369 length:1017 start_codon:yes stop_codon:yes gene_type:complete
LLNPKKQFTVVVQGPFNDNLANSRFFIQSYLDLGYPVVISTWDFADNDEVYGDKKFELRSSQYNADVQNFIIEMANTRNVTVVQNPLPVRLKHKHYMADSTFYWALKSQKYAMENVKTEYVVKTRSDEGFFPISSIIDYYNTENKEIVCGDIFAKRPSRHNTPSKFHIGDHIYVCNTKVINSALDLILYTYEKSNNKVMRKKCRAGCCTAASPSLWCTEHPRVAESILAEACLRVIYGDRSHDKPYWAIGPEHPSKGPEDLEIMKYISAVSIFNINKFDSYVARWGCNDISYFKRGHFLDSIISSVTMQNAVGSFNAADHPYGISDISEYEFYTSKQT